MVLAHVVGLFCTLLLHRLTSSSPALVFPKKNNMAKSLGPFDIRKVPESKKHAKQGNLLRSVKTK
jgi:hypothetical protein